MGYFAKATPEEVGIHSEGILKFLETVEKEKLELHSLMVIRHGKCCGAGWWSPYGPEYIHSLFSFSKSFTSTAIGFAEQEGLLSLDEKIVDIFPEYIPENPSENRPDMLFQPPRGSRIITPVFLHGRNLAIQYSYICPL